MRFSAFKQRVASLTELIRAHLQPTFWDIRRVGPAASGTGRVVIADKYRTVVSTLAVQQAVARRDRGGDYDGWEAKECPQSCARAAGVHWTSTIDKCGSLCLTPPVSWIVCLFKVQSRRYSPSVGATFTLSQAVAMPLTHQS